MIFCIGEGQWEHQGSGYQKNLMAWNKPVTKERYRELVKEVSTILSDFNIDPRKSWTEEWQRVHSSQWSKIAKIPEFDLEITKKITGLSRIEVDEEKTVEIEGKKFTISELKSLISSAK